MNIDSRLFVNEIMLMAYLKSVDFKFKNWFRKTSFQLEGGGGFFSMIRFQIDSFPPSMIQFQKEMKKIKTWSLTEIEINSIYLLSEFKKAFRS